MEKVFLRVTVKSKHFHYDLSSVHPKLECIRLFCLIQNILTGNLIFCVSCKVAEPKREVDFSKIQILKNLNSLVSHHVYSVKPFALLKSNVTVKKSFFTKQCQDVLL